MSTRAPVHEREVMIGPAQAETLLRSGPLDVDLTAQTHR